MSTPLENKPAVRPVETSVPTGPCPAERLVRHLKRAGSIVLVILFVALTLALSLAIPVGYHWLKYQACLVPFSEFICQLMAVTRLI
jgi:hypothetical protein